MKSSSLLLLSILAFSSCVKLGNGSGPGTPGYIDTIGIKNIVTTIAGNGAGFSNGPDSTAQFNTPFGLALDNTGHIYVADQLNSCIRKIDTTVNYVSTFAGTGTSGFLNGNALSAQFDLPMDVAIDKYGNVFVADQGNNIIRMITPSGMVSSFAGSGAPGLVDGDDTTAEFLSPQGVAVDTSGNIYVADAGNNCIRKITPAGITSTLAGALTHGFTNGTGGVAQFSKPEGVAVDANGNIYIADAGNNVIRKITPTGEVSTFAGSGAFGYADGSGSAAQFSAPAGVAVDASGNVYVADEYNARIRKITPQGIVTTIAGTGSFGFADGTGNIAEFNYPAGVAVDAAGNIYVADANNNCVRKITLP
jgi:serine/threonine protein kinase, bacterial